MTITDKSGGEYEVKFTSDRVELIPLNSNAIGGTFPLSAFGALKDSYDMEEGMKRLVSAGEGGIKFREIYINYTYNGNIHVWDFVKQTSYIVRIEKERRFEVLGIAIDAVTKNNNSSIFENVQNSIKNFFDERIA